MQEAKTLEKGQDIESLYPSPRLRETLSNSKNWGHLTVTTERLIALLLANAGKIFGKRKCFQQQNLIC